MEQNCKLGNRHTHKYSQVIFDNEAVAIQCKKMSFQKLVLEQFGHQYKKNLNKEPTVFIKKRLKMN